MANPLGAAPGIIIGVGVGTAAAAAIEPAVELPKQTAWSQNKVRVLDPAVMARLVAAGGVDISVANDDAAREGYDTDKVAALVYLAQTVPGFAQAMTMWRRQTINDADFSHTLVKGAVDARYYTAIEALKDEWLTPAQIALGIIRGLIPDPGLLAVDLSTAGSNVPTYPASTVNALTEALGGGIDTERLRVLVGTIGLPPSVQQLASMVFRGIVTEGAYNQGVMEGDARPEWAPYWLEQAREILTAGEYAELELRGFYDAPTRRANTAKHGMSDTDSDLLFNVLGRGLSLHQMVVGKARGGVYGKVNPAIPADELASMQRGNLRPEYYDIAWHGRYGYPTGFQIKAETVSKGLTQVESNQILLEIGWDPKWATHFSTSWAGGATKAGTAVKKETQALLTQEYLSGVLSPAAFTTALGGLGYDATQAANILQNTDFKAASAERTRNTRLIEKQYVAVKSSEAQARQQLATLGWPQGVIDNKISAWNIERDIAVTTLTVAQIAAALKKGVLLASVAAPLLADLGENPAAIQTIIATSGANPAT